MTAAPARAHALSHLHPYVSVFNSFLAKSEGKDKLLATLQYAAMLLAAGRPGSAALVQKNLVAARKPFRILKPVELIAPLLTGPAAVGPFHMVVLNKAKSILSAIYFGCDHIVWAGQTGIYGDKDWLDFAQKMSIYGWLGASLCGIVQELINAARAARKAAKGNLTDAEKKAEAAAASKRLLLLAHGLTQAALATGLLQMGPLKGKPRATALFGVVTSLLACYMVMDPLPKPAVLELKPKAQ